MYFRPSSKFVHKYCSRDVFIQMKIVHYVLKQQKPSNACIYLWHWVSKVIDHAMACSLLMCEYWQTLKKVYSSSSSSFAQTGTTVLRMKAAVKSVWHCFQSGLLTSVPVPCVDFSSILIDYNLYRKFWSLQDYFRKPVQCFDKAAWRAFAMVCSPLLFHQRWSMIMLHVFPPWAQKNKQNTHWTQCNITSCYSI